jgi:hypothetical protein
MCNTPGAPVAAAEQLVQKYLTGLFLCLPTQLPLPPRISLNYYYEGISVRVCVCVCVCVCVLGCKR